MRLPSTLGTTLYSKLFPCSILMASSLATIVHLWVAWILTDNGLPQVWNNIQKTAPPKWWWEKHLRAVTSSSIVISMVTQDARIYSCTDAQTSVQIDWRKESSHCFSIKTVKISISNAVTSRFRSQRKLLVESLCGRSSNSLILSHLSHLFAVRLEELTKTTTSQFSISGKWAKSSVSLYATTLVMKQRSEKQFKS